jgi:hypothetical protein
LIRIRGETCYPFSRARTRARARQYDDEYEHEHGFDPPVVADTMIKTGRLAEASAHKPSPGMARSANTPYLQRRRVLGAGLQTVLDHPSRLEPLPPGVDESGAPVPMRHQKKHEKQSRHPA